MNRPARALLTVMIGTGLALTAAPATAQAANDTVYCSPGGDGVLGTPDDFCTTQKKPLKPRKHLRE